MLINTKFLMYEYLLNTISISLDWILIWGLGDLKVSLGKEFSLPSINMSVTKMWMFASCGHLRMVVQIFRISV